MRSLFIANDGAWDRSSLIAGLDRKLEKVVQDSQAVRSHASIPKPLDGEPSRSKEQSTKKTPSDGKASQTKEHPATNQKPSHGEPSRSNQPSARAKDCSRFAAPNVIPKPPKHNPPLHDAVKKSNANDVSAQSTKRPQAKSKEIPYSGHVPPDFAASYLLSELSGSDPQLHRAARNGDADWTKKLIVSGVDVNSLDGNGWTALHIAANKGHQDVVRLLLDNAADPNIRIYDSQSILRLRKGVDVEYGATALHQAVWKGHGAIVRLLLGHRVDTGMECCNGLTVLRLAVLTDSEAMVQLLLANGVNVNHKGFDGRTALHTAAKTGNVRIAKTLLGRGALVDAGAGRTMTPLQRAAMHGHEKMVKLLRDRGADIEAVDENQATALHAAARSGHAKVIQYLVDEGANRHARAIFNKDKPEERSTPYTFALRSGHEKVAPLLRVSSTRTGRPTTTHTTGTRHVPRKSRSEERQALVYEAARLSRLTTDSSETLVGGN